MTKAYLGIDIGTSSLKGLWKVPGGPSQTIRISYQGDSVALWQNAMRRLFAEMPREVKESLAGIAFSSQVGSYITDDLSVIPWHSAIGGEELRGIKEKISEDVFLSEIGMRHPDIVSYPLPRMQYLTRHGMAKRLMMPKEFFVEELTGRYATDIFSMRGLAHPQNGYARKLLATLGIDMELPLLLQPTDCAGTVTKEAAQRYQAPEGVPVYLGCNDFFAGLLGLGIWQEDTAFDLTGTSEHFGFISEDLQPDAFVSGGYFHGFCSYGGTKSSGSAGMLARQWFSDISDVDISVVKRATTPIFLPYLQGERAPIYDENARGVFFGITKDTSKESMVYAMTEGVAFSLYHIAQTMKMPTVQKVICGGGRAEDALFNRVKAELFGCQMLPAREKDSSALGAALLAMVGSGEYPDLPSAIRENVSYGKAVPCSGEYTSILRERYRIYKQIYCSLKGDFPDFNRIYGGEI